jgi:hypothetical protein
VANYANVHDEDLRKQFEGAHGHLRAQRGTEAVHAIVQAFESMIAARPELLDSTRPGRRGPIRLAAAWPALGANFAAGSSDDEGRKIVFTKQRFAMSEAITYYEFVVEAAIAEGM